MSGNSRQGFASESTRAAARRRFAVGLALSVCACVGVEEETSSPVGRTRASVIGGVDSPPERDAVVFVRVTAAAQTWNDCSGTLVSPRIVVTARHCVTQLQPGSFVCRPNGEIVRDGTGAGVFGADVEPSSIEIHVGALPADAIAARGAALVTSGSDTACRDDVAAVILDRAIELPAYAPMRLSKATLLGEKLRLVGYGTGERAGIVARREVDDARVVDVANAGAAFDERRATTPRRTLVVAGNNLCSGDSGGAALSMETGALVGIYSRVTGDCFAVESRNTFMLTSGFTSLFDAAFALTGEAPLEELQEPDPGSGGTDGVGGESVETAGAGGTEAVAPEGGAPTEPEAELGDASGGDAFRCSVQPVPARSPAAPAIALGILAAAAIIRRFRQGVCAGA